MSVTALVFVVIYCLALVGALVVSPLWGFGAYFWVFYNHPPNRWWGVALPDLRWSYTAGIVMLIAVLGKPRSSSRPDWLNSQVAWLLIAYTTWMWIQTVFAVDTTIHFEGCILYTKYVLLFFVIYRLAEDKDYFRLIVWAHVIGCFIFGWIAYRMEVGGRLESIGGPGVDDSNTLAMHLSTGLAVAGFLFLKETLRLRVVLVLLLVFVLNGVIETQSRGAMVALAAAAPVGVYLCPHSFRRVTYAAIGLGIVLLLSLANEGFWNRAQTIELTEESKMESSAASRIALMRYGWAMFLDYPLGAGHRSHETLSANYMPAYMLSSGTNTRAAHNTFMAVLVEQGIVGALLYLLLSVWVIRELRRLKHMDAQGLPVEFGLYRAGIGCALTTAYVAGIFSSYLKAEVNIWLLALLTALSTICQESLPAQQEEPAQARENVPRNRFALRLNPGLYGKRPL